MARYETPEPKKKMDADDWMIRIMSTILAMSLVALCGVLSWAIVVWIATEPFWALGTFFSVSVLAFLVRPLARRIEKGMKF